MIGLVTVERLMGFYCPASSRSAQRFSTTVCPDTTWALPCRLLLETLDALLQFTKRAVPDGRTGNLPAFFK
jgi:hypothetical protein